MIIGRDQIGSRLLFAPALGLAYVNNPKVACSSIKQALWIAASPGTFQEGTSPHDRVHAPFLPSPARLHDQLDQVVDAAKFTVVRNPYVRILSAYLDKVGRPDRDTAVFHPFARRFALQGDEEVSFSRFLELVSSEDPSFLDDHFAPQYVTTMSEFVPLDFVGRIEEVHLAWAFLEGYGVTRSEHRPHATNARALVSQYYGDREVDMVSTFYRRDFELFGYSLDPAILDPVGPAQLPPVERTLIASLLDGLCHRDPVMRARSLEAVAGKVAGFDLNYSRAESELLSAHELTEFALTINQNPPPHWKLILAYTSQMIRSGMVQHASFCILRLRTLLYSS